MRRFFATVLAAALVVFLHATSAFAHATLVKAEPADGAVIAQAPASLRLTFNEPVSPLAIRLIGPGGGTVALGEIGAADAKLNIAVPPLGTGTHVLSWRVISADGHPVGGSLVFSIGAPSAHPQEDALQIADPGVRVALWAAKVAIYLGLFVGIGGAFFRAWIGANPSGRPRESGDPDFVALDSRLRGNDHSVLRGASGMDIAAPTAEPFVIAALIAGLLAVPLSVGLQGLDALDLALREIARASVWETGLDTAYGLTAIAAAFALFAALFSFAAPTPRIARALSLFALVGVGLALALSGHASNAAPRIVSRPAVFVHAVCVTFWAGSLLPLMATLRASPPGDAPLRRFSRAIPVPLALLAMSGAWLAIVQLGHVDALWTTGYGRVLAAKLSAVAVLLVLAAANRYWLVPRFAAQGATAARPLRMSIAAEFVIVLAILALVALWRFTPPPRSLAAATTVSVHIHGEKAMAQIEIERDRADSASARIQVLDGAFRPLAAKEVTLVLANPAAGIEPLRRAAARAEGEASWRVDDLRIPVGGRWTLRVEVLITDFDKAMLEDTVMLPRLP